MTSERCVAMLRCCACAILCTRRETGSSLSEQSHTAVRLHPSHLSTCLCLSLSEAVRSITQADLQKSILKLKKSKSVGGVGALLHAALD